MEFTNVLSSLGISGQPSHAKMWGDYATKGDQFFDMLHFVTAPYQTDKKEM